MSVNPEARRDELRAGVSSGRPEASAAIWPWRGARAARPVHTRGQAVRKALIGVAVAGVAALVLWLALGRPGFALVVAGIATALFLLAVIAPAGFFAVHFKVEAFARWVANGVTWLLLAPLFFLFFFPFGKLFRRGRRDPMERQLMPESGSYWRERSGDGPDAESYERQF